MKFMNAKGIIAILILWNIVLTYKLFMVRDASYRIVNAERINIIEEDGTKKLGLFSSGQYQQGISQREGQNTISGMLFFNEEGYETGGLVYDGKKITGGQNASIGLMFDGYRQDQTISLQHNERNDEEGSYYEDGLRIISRPDRADVEEEYNFYSMRYPEKFGIEDTLHLSDRQLDSLEFILAGQNKIAKQRVFLGSKRGLKDGKWFDESGLYIKNKYGNNVIKIFVDETNIPKIEVCDSLGNSRIVNLIPSEQ